MRALRLLLLACLSALFAWMPAVHATAVQTQHAEAELVADVATARLGARFTAALRIVHEAEWHTYWRNPGDSGMPTRLAWRLPPGVEAGEIQWPVPGRLPVGPLMNYGYDGELLLPVEITLPRDWPAGKPVTLSARADWLICKDICIPGGADVSLDLATSAAATTPSPWKKVIADARARVPSDAGPLAPRVAVTETHIALEWPAKALSNTPHPETLAFFPIDPEIIDNAAAQRFEKTGTGYRLLLAPAPTFKGQITSLNGVLTATPALGPSGRPLAVSFSVPYPGGFPRAAQPAATTVPMTADDIRGAAQQSAPAGLWLSLVLAFAGGLVLNLMPCVFPVVSIKILGFADQAHGNRRRLRTYGIMFALGIVTCFWLVAGVLLALRAGGEALGWGYQLQSPPIVAGLAVLFFLLGLNLSGLFEFGGGIQRAAGAVRGGDGRAGAFLGGMLATLIATPCTAPFMGAALGFALTQPAAVAMLVFTSLALGMSAPYVLLSFFPEILRRLPRPGRWMETLKQILAFPLYLTVVWLVWVLGQQAGITAAAKLLAGMVFAAAAIWTWRRFGTHARIAAAVAVAALVTAGALLAWPPAESAAAKSDAVQSGWAPFSEDALQKARANGPVFVDFTAAWCVTCQVNKRVVLERTEVEAEFARLSVTRMRADWTRRDEHITQALAKLGRSGVPVYALFAKGNGPPELLPELLTRDIVFGALGRAAGRPALARSP